MEHINKIPLFKFLMSGRDVIGVAATGSGKTLAFMLPAIVHIAVRFFTGPKIDRMWSQRCTMRGSLEKLSDGLQEKPALLCRCKIQGIFHFSHQILSPLTIYLLLKRLKI